MSTETPPSKRRVQHIRASENPSELGIKDGEIFLPVSLETVKHIRRGIEFRVVKDVADHLAIDTKDILAVIGVRGGTIYRRKKENLLKADESNRLYRLMKIAALAERVLVGREKAGEWMLRPNRTLGDISPFSLLDTFAGADAVEDLLQQIEFGVYC